MYSQPNNILIIEQDSRVAEELARLLEASLQIEITHPQLETKQELTALLRQKKWDLILCEYNHPWLSPATIIQEAGSLHPPIPVIMMANAPDLAAVVDMVKRGAEDFIDKQDKTRLTELVQQLLDPDHSPQNTGRPISESPSASGLRATIKALRKSEEKFAKAFKVSPDSMAISRVADGIFIEVNDSYLREAGYLREEMIGHSALELGIWADQRQRIKMVQVLKEQGSIVDLEAQLCRKNGEKIDALISAEVIEVEGVACLLAAIKNITEWKKAEAELRASEKRYRQMFEMHGLPKLIIEPETGQLIDANLAACKFFGIGLAELKTKNIRELVSPASAEEWEKSATEPLSEMTSLEMTQRRADGELRVIEVFSGPLEIDGKMVLYSINTDVTEKHRAITALEEANNLLERRVAERTAELEKVNNRLAAIFNNSGDGILMVNLKEGIQQANQTFEKLFGLQPDSYLGLKLEDLFGLENSAEIQKAVQEVAATHHKREIQTTIAVSGVEIEITLAPVISSENSVVSLVCTIRDITDRKLAEKILRESEEKFRQYIESAPVAVIVVDRNGRITLVNKSAETLFEYGRDELINQAVELLVPEESRPRHPELREEYLSRETSHTGETLEMVARRKNGKVFPADIKLSYIEHQKNPLIMSFIVDITQRKRAEQALVEALAQEKAVGELKSRFVSIASHEFRTPLASILATTESLLSYRERMASEQINGRLIKIKQQILHLKDILEDVLQLSKIQANRVELKPLPWDITALCRDIIEEFESQPQNQGRVEFGFTDPPIIFGFDSHLMRGIITNLISNALKYSPPDKIVTVKLGREEDQVVLKVIDQGIGIPAENLTHLFEPFYRATNVEGIPGTGLGLSITEQSVKLHGGRLEVESEVGKGTTMIVRLPAGPGGEI